jgi:hypothetical protein
MERNGGAEKLCFWKTFQHAVGRERQRGRMAGMVTCNWVTGYWVGKSVNMRGSVCLHSKEFSEWSPGAR